MVHIDIKPKLVFGAQPFLAFKIFSWKHTRVEKRKYGYRIISTKPVENGEVEFLDWKSDKHL